MYSNQSVGTSYVAARIVLPCEFVGYSGCEMTFDVDDVHNWIEHIAREHLGDKLPKKAFCWFCDDIKFDSRVVGDRRLNFEQRMWHIRDHFVEEGRTINSIRPDHHFNTHLRDNGLIGEDTYNSVRRYSEAPVPPHVLDASAMYSMQQNWSEGSSRSQMAYTDTRKEDRERQRRRHGKGKN